MLLQINPKFKQSDLESQILKFWNDNQVFTKLINQTDKGTPWVMIDGPVTANNRLGVHHGWGRTYKDIFQRFHAMKGNKCLWQNGFDCQGLWVEVETEKELNINGPYEIESMGIGKFTSACSDRVNKFTKIIIDQSKLLGQWANWPNSYRTDSSNNIQHIWMFLKKCQQKNLLHQGLRIMPWCTRCGTSLSQHEMADSYEEKVDTAIDFLCLSHTDKKQAFVSWTTTPWTIPANSALAVHPDMDYVLVETNTYNIWMSKECKNRTKSDMTIKDTKKGNELVGLNYEPPYPFPGIEYKIIPWDGIDKNTGSGFVHIAPAFGADDYNLWKKHQFNLLEPLNENGTYNTTIKQFANKHWQKINQEVIDDLMNRQLLSSVEKHSHRYPHCWRCKEPVIFRLCKEWFILVSKIREDLLQASKAICWHPEHIGLHMSNWLENMGDWCISRRRFWGLPLPFYQCSSCNHVTVIGDFDELAEKAIVPFNVYDLHDGDVHRPYIDTHNIMCENCGKSVSRIKEVGDCWLDAGIVPFSTFNYIENGLSPQYPFDFAIEMREQVRLWFYSTLVMGVVLEGKAPISHISTYDEMRNIHGQKFSKTKGNAPSLDKIIEEFGADVLRYALAEAPTDQIFQFDPSHLKKGKQTFNTLWNCYAYFSQYANIDQPKLTAPDMGKCSELDLWLLAQLEEYIRETSLHLDGYNARSALFNFKDFIDNLSTWYIRLSRPIFAGPDCEAKTQAYCTLWTALCIIPKVMAPLFPFTAEQLHQSFVRPTNKNAAESVHLTSWANADAKWHNKPLLNSMRDVQDIVQIALSIRNSAKYKVRQPLLKAVIENWPNAEPWQKNMIAQETNVLNVLTNEPIPEGAFKVTCHDMIVHIDLELNDELKELGAVRELIRLIQDKRKEMGLTITNKITLVGVFDQIGWSKLQKYLNEILKKTHAINMTRVEVLDHYFEANLEALGNIKLQIITH